MIKRDENPEYLNAFLDYSATILNKSPNSIKEYNYDLGMFLRFIKIHFKMTSETEFNKITIDDITIEDLEKVKLEDIHAFLSYLSNTHHSKAATRARIFFKYLSQKAGLLKINPAQNLENPKQDKRLPKYLSLDDSKKLLDAASDEDNRNYQRDYAITTLFLNCGMRLSELVNINVKDINFSDCKLNVIGKGNKERTIYLNKACIISKELEKAGLDTRKYSVHKLRHTAATLMYQYGQVDIRALQELLGHESISTTEIYTHVNNEQIRNAVERNPLADI